jgi:hypothetical protein
MQIHPGVLRNHNTAIGNSYGRDKGYDIPIQTEFTRALRPMLDQSGPIRGCASSSSPSTRLCTAGNWPRLPVRILRFDWAHRGGSWTPPRECAGSGSPPPRPPASQHLRLCGRHTGVRVHTRSARPLPSRRCRLSRAFGPGASAQPGRGGGDGHRPGVPPAQGVISAALTHYGPAVF